MIFYQMSKVLSMIIGSLQAPDFSLAIHKIFLYNDGKR